MSKNQKNFRVHWVRPELKRLEAGAAEFGSASHIDNGPAGNAAS